MQEVYEMDGIPVHRLSPNHAYQVRQQHVVTNHVPTLVTTSLQPPLHSQPPPPTQLLLHPSCVQSSPTTFDGRVLTTPVLTYQPSPQQATYSTVMYPQPVLVVDRMAAQFFQDRSVKMDYIRKVLGVLFTQIGVCFLIVNVFNLR